MQCRAKRGISCVPVTALHVVEHGSGPILFFNEGSNVNVALAGNGAVVHSRRIFRSQIIHGITSGPGERHEAITRHHVVIWGGRLICNAILTIDHTVYTGESSGLYFETTRPRVVDDWIMTVVTDSAAERAVLLTAHNVLWTLSLTLHPSCLLLRLGRGMKTLLYSGAITVIDAGRILVASGTIFGEVIVWTCSESPSSEDWVSLTQHLFLGHRGSVFGVAVSDNILHNNQGRRLLASCSDDRTIRIWDISDCVEAEMSPAVTQCVSVDTGFGLELDHNLELAVTWGHLSRIWGVNLVGMADSDNDMIRFVSRGEDGACEYWNLSLHQLFERGAAARKDVLRAIGVDRHHAGKNVWSLTTSLGGPQPMIYTGGADGQVKLRRYPGGEGRIETSIKFNDVTRLLHLNARRLLKKYLVFEEGTIIATTDEGEVVQTSVKAIDDWSFIYQPTMKGTTVLCENSKGGLMFYSLATGAVCAYDVIHNRLLGPVFGLSSQAAWMQIANFERGPDHTRVVHIITSLHGGRHPELWEVSLGENEITASSQTIYLPADFAISASLYRPALDLLICGSRAGAVTVLTVSEIGTEPVDEKSITRHVHGSDTVTSITILPRASELVHILTTGRDGTFAVHSLQVHIRGLKLDTVHRMAPPFGPFVEGAFLRTTGTQQQMLCLYGFKSKDFVVWNETDQTQVLSVDCGGAHRNWGFSPGQEDTDVFVWTKAGTFNHVSISRSTLKSIRKGSHGREIKALAVSSMRDLPMPDGVDLRDAKLVATGAEDTDVRLMICSHASIFYFGVLRHHTTGLQALCFSRCGRYLFSSGGVEEFAVWKLTRVPVIGIGVTVVCTLPKNEGDEDARIMSFDVVDQDSTDSRARLFYIAMAYSNGKVKVFEFHREKSSSCGHLRLLQTLVVGTLCLSQVRLLRNANRLSMLVGATDGWLRHNDMDGPTDRVVSQHLHQSNIATMSVCELRWQRYLVVTGGDDNSLAITLLHVSGNQTAFKTLLVPRAHAAALTAATIVSLSNGRCQRTIYIVSGGNDQRVRVWQVLGLTFIENDAREDNESLESDLEPELASASLRKICEYAVDVADISGLELIRHGEVKNGVEFEVIVVGVGMQSIRFQIEP